MEFNLQLIDSIDCSLAAKFQAAKQEKRKEINVTWNK